MCGIVGIASKNVMGKKEKDFFSQALYADLLRGKDSTGIFTVGKGKNHDIELCKKAYPSYDFMELSRPSQMIDNLDKACLAVGHNRAATKGGVNHSNAHPFQHGDITLVHNGTLNVYNDLPGYNRNEVDSRLLCRGISELGIKDTVDKIVGAYALVWHDASDNSLHFLRNNKRKFAMAISKGNKSIYWASEIKMLEWLINRNNLEFSEIFETEEDLHISFNLDEAEFNPTTETVEKEVVTTNYNYHGMTNTTASTTYHTNAPYLEAKAAHEKEGFVFPKVGDTIEGYFWEVTPYVKEGSHGKMLGIGMEPHYFDIELNGITVESFSEGYYSLEVISVTYDRKENTFLVRGRKPVLTLKFDDDSMKEISEPEKKSQGTLKLLIENPNPIAESLELEAFDKTVKHGCSSCCRDLHYEEKDLITWVDSQTPICPECCAEDTHYNRKH